MTTYDTVLGYWKDQRYLIATLEELKETIIETTILPSMIRTGIGISTGKGYHEENGEWVVNFSDYDLALDELNQQFPGIRCDISR